MSAIREVVTKKAFAAISKYVTIKVDERLSGLPLHHYMVKFVLEAERMERRRLYGWLERQGYRWRREVGFWEKKAKK